MQFSRIGVGADGRSKVVEQRDCEPKFTSQYFAFNTLWEADHLPPRNIGAPRRPKDAHWRDLGVPPGGSRWFVFSLAAGEAGPMAHSSTMMCELVVKGEVTLGLQDGELLMRPGDCMLMPGLEHTWKAGPQGCTLVGVIYGLPEVGEEAASDGPPVSAALANAVGERLIGIVTRGDMNDLRKLFTDDGIVWDAHDQLDIGMDQVVANMTNMRQNAKRIFYENVRRQPTPTGFVQEHVFCLEMADGKVMRAPHCCLIHLEGERIKRMEAYCSAPASPAGPSRPISTRRLAIC